MPKQFFLQHPIKTAQVQWSKANAILLATEPFFQQAAELGQTFKKEVDLQKLETIDLKILDELKKTWVSLSHYSSRIIPFTYPSIPPETKNPLR